jgi:hypothetical protein
MFYGVTIVERSFASQGIESEFVDGQEFAAQFFLADSGTVNETPPAVAATPLLVYWYGPDAPSGVALYNCAPSGGASFTLVPGAATAGRATIAADGSTIFFDGADAPVLATSAAGVTVAALHDTVPTDLPQLIFYYGAALLAVVSTSGFWARVIEDGTLPGTTGFQLQYQGVTVAEIAPGESAALAWTANS